jgi:Holliday junction resolvasome RuvABC endonuclease subunit|tara:strand:- start:562 stop:1113 length:552 start_codon:yes stop_codon:yes gene_type:complete
MSLNRVILGLDISTSRIGIAAVTTDENLVFADTISFKKKEMPLLTRAFLFENTIGKILKVEQMHPMAVYVEEPFTMFSGGRTTANTMAKLQRFNGMCCYAIRRGIYNMDPELIPARTCRSLNEIKIPRGSNTKQLIIDWVSQKYPKDFKYELTRHGNPKPGTDDKADAVVVALAGLKKFKENA